MTYVNVTITSKKEPRFTLCTITSNVGCFTLNCKIFIFFMVFTKSRKLHTKISTVPRMSLKET